MSSPTPLTVRALSVDMSNLPEKQSPEHEFHVKNQSAKWVLNSPDPPGFCQPIFDMTKKKLFPQRNSRPWSLSSHVIALLTCVFPVLDWGRNYKASKFKNDLISGLTLASLSIPQSIGYAALANLDPQYGLYGSVVPPLIYSVMGTSQELAIGPVAVVSLLISSMVSKLVDPTLDPVSYRKLVFTATLFAGSFQALFGLLRLGFLIDFLSHAAIVGFMAGAAIVIGLQQLKSLLGISHFTTKTDVVSVLDAVVKSLHTSQWYPLNFLLGCSFLIFILITRFIGKRNKKLFWIPAISPVISVILSTLIVYLSRADQHGVKIIKHFKGGLNPSSVNQLEFNGPHLGETAKIGFICAIIALTEAVAVGRSFASIKGYNLDGNKEMLAIGFMNIAGSMSSCYVTTGSFSRTAVNFSAGCQSTVSNIVMAVTVLISLQLFTKLLYYTPLAILASIILSALPGLIDYNEAYHIWKVDKLDFLACAGAFFGVLFASVEIGLLVAYKVVAKILALRLAEVVETVVGTDQTAFVRGRQILEGPLMVSELVNWYKKQKKRMMILKIDFEKAYDSLSWAYLDQVMGFMGFPVSWCRWITACLHSSRSSVLVNGSPSAEFRLFRGLRQGDPLSPFLFILAMEGLHVAMEDAVAAGLYKPLSVGSDNFKISHFLYADDALFVGEWSKSNVDNLVCLLHCFYLVSGLRLNLSKSNLFGIGVSIEELDGLATIVGCKAAKLPFVYLGLPVGENMARLKGWEVLIDKFRSKLSRWKVNMLSIGGRSVLIKAVLGGLGIYFLSLFVMPVTIAKKLESLRSNFFWGGTENNKKFAWVKWDQVLATREAGGLGIGSLVSFNLALILKWQWKFFNSPDAPWVRLLKIFYGRSGGFHTGGRPSAGASPWSRILAATLKLHDAEVVPRSMLRRKIGNGEDTRFWEDCWVGDKPLSIQFPRLFALDGDGGCRVADRWDGRAWRWQWQRSFDGGRTFAELQSLRQILDGVGCTLSTDTWVWNLSSDGSFNVADTRKWIDDRVLPVGNLKTRWSMLLPRKVNIFIWRLLLDRLPTRERLSARGIEIESIMCPVCGLVTEHLLHLFCQCTVATSIWDHLFRWLQIPSFGVLNPKEILGWVEDCRLRANQKKVLEVVVCAALWILWRYRNDVIHESRKMRKGVLIDCIKEFSFVWFRNRQHKVVVSWTDWLQFPLNVL